MSLIPHEAEVALAATIVANPGLAPEVLARVQSGSFANKLAAGLVALVESGKATNPSSVAALLNINSDEPLATDDIYQMAVPPSEVAELTRIVAEYHMRRIISAESMSLLTAVSDPSKDPQTVWSGFVAKTIQATTTERAPRLLSTILETLGQEEEGMRLYTGDRFYDEFYYAKGGSRRTQIEYVLAQPGHGKSSYLARMAYLFAKAGNNVLWFQFENSATATARTMAYYPAGPWTRNITISDAGHFFQDIQMESRRYKQTNRLDVVVIDYLQIVHFLGIRPNEVRQQVMAVSSGIREFAKSENCYCIVGCQADRAKDRKGYEAWPGPADGRESSQIESDAFVMTSLFRPHKKDELRIEDGNMVKSYDGMRSVPKNIVYARNVKNRDDKDTFAPFAFLHEDQLYPYNDKEGKVYAKPSGGYATSNAIAARVVDDEPNW